MRFSLRSLLIFTGLLAIYLGFHVWLERTHPNYHKPFSELNLIPFDAIYWYRVPKDIASLIACCCLLQFAAVRRDAVFAGVAACALSICLSCSSFYFFHWMPGFYSNHMRIAWSAFGSLTWVLMVCALFYAIRVAPTRINSLSTTVFICLLATYVGFQAWAENVYPIIAVASSLTEEISYWHKMPKDIALLVGCCFLFQIAGERRSAAAIGVGVCSLSISLSCFGFFFTRWLYPTYRYSTMEFYLITLDSFLWILMVSALLYAVQVAPARDLRRQ